MRQIVLIYYRKRDKHGVPRKIEDQWYEPGDEKADKKTFIELGLFLGRKLEDLEAEWAKATNGNT